MTMTVERAIELVARHAIASAAEDLGDSWESYDGVGEYDWDAVVAKAAELYPFPGEAEYAEAIALLETRVDPEALP